MVSERHEPWGCIKESAGSYAVTYEDSVVLDGLKDGRLVKRVVQNMNERGVRPLGMVGSPAFEGQLSRMGRLFEAADPDEVGDTQDRGVPGDGEA
jgi:hypothetical protein